MKNAGMDKNNELMLSNFGKMNEIVLTELQNNVNGFQRAYLRANAISEIKSMLTPEYMAKITPLQGTKLGFRTDKDKDGGYPVEIVKNCLIEAVFIGLQPFNNEFNIIAGNCYPTKEGMKALLKQVNGLTYAIQVKDITFTQDKRQASAKTIIEWSIDGKSESKELDFVVPSNQYATHDAIYGKAEKRARTWLYQFITGSDVVESEIEQTKDVSYTDVTKEEAKKEKEFNELKEQLKSKILDSKTVAEIMRLEKYIEKYSLQELFDEKKTELMENEI